MDNAECPCSTCIFIFRLGVRITCHCASQTLHLDIRGGRKFNLSTYRPGPLSAADIAALIAKEKPAVVFAPQVETSTGIIIDDAYIINIFLIRLMRFILLSIDFSKH